MNYELIKRLKDTGFPFKIDACSHCEQAYAGFEEPTLSELIEACGDKFGGLSNYITFWQANPQTESFEGTGDTPEEAVAELYLALNSK